MNRHSSLQTGVRSVVLPLVAIVLAITIFIADTIADLEIAISVFYVAVVLISLSFCRSRGVVAVSAGCMALTTISYFLSPTGSPQSGLINSMIGLTAIGITTSLVLKIQSAEIAMLEARAQLAHVARLTTLGELTASIAHEVNQPLAAIVSSGNACLHWLDGQTPNIGKARQSVERILGDANRASEIVIRVRALAKRTSSEREWLNLNEAIRGMIELMRSEIEQNHIKLRYELADDLPRVLADRVQLQQVLLNLILNAIEAVNAVSDGRREVLITSARAGTDGVEIAIRDSGIGLDVARIDHVFDAFHTTKPGGIGIGLTISRSIIEAHGGQIWATPNDRRGATFQFTLPGGQDRT